MPARATLIRGDALKALATLPDASIDLVLTDPPYGTTQCKWDAVIPLEPMWRELRRVLRPGGAIVMTACQPFTSALIVSNPKMFRYSLVWEKNISTGFLNAKRQPLRKHEDIVVFAKRSTVYNPQMTPGAPYSKLGGRGPPVYGRFERERCHYGATRYPTSILEFATVNHTGVHPTQKPVALMEYLIRTYSNAGDAVLDFTMGSGTTGVAAARSGRQFIGIELNAKYYGIARDRIASARAGDYGRTNVGQKLRERRKVGRNKARLPLRLVTLRPMVRSARRAGATSGR